MEKDLHTKVGSVLSGGSSNGCSQKGVIEERLDAVEKKLDLIYEHIKASTKCTQSVGNMERNSLSVNRNTTRSRRIYSRDISEIVKNTQSLLQQTAKLQKSVVEIQHSILSSACKAPRLEKPMDNELIPISKPAQWKKRAGRFGPAYIDDSDEGSSIGNIINQWFY